MPARSRKAPAPLRRISILEALADRALLGANDIFADLNTWRAWLVFLSAVYGLPLSRRDRRLFCKHTGHSRYRPPPGGYAESVVVVGRQSGKSRIAATIAAYEAVLSVPEMDGTEVYSLLIAQDARGALRTLLSYSRAAIGCSPVLSQSILNDKANDICLDTGVRIAAYPCRPASVRGLRRRGEERCRWESSHAR